MREKTLDEEIPSVKEALEIYIKECEKELSKRGPIVRRLRLARKKAVKKLVGITGKV